MIGWMEPVIPHLKGLHVIALALWCAGLFALPLMLARHDPAIGAEDYSRIRRATHYGYTFVITPAALIAIASGLLGWQPHTVRAALTRLRQQGCRVDRCKDEQGATIYRLGSPKPRPDGLPARKAA